MTNFGKDQGSVVQAVRGQCLPQLLGGDAAVQKHARPREMLPTSRGGWGWAGAGGATAGRAGPGRAQGRLPQAVPVQRECVCSPMCSSMCSRAAPTGSPPGPTLSPGLRTPSPCPSQHPAHALSKPSCKSCGRSFQTENMTRWRDSCSLLAGGADACSRVE